MTTVTTIEIVRRDIAEADDADSLRYAYRVCGLADRHVELGFGAGYTGKVFCISGLCDGACELPATPARLAAFNEHIARLRRNNAAATREERRYSPQRIEENVNCERRQIG